MFVGFRLSNSHAVRRLEAKARQKGEPITLAELASKHPPPPDAENAAVPLIELWEKEDPAFWQAYRLGVRPLPKRKDTKEPKGIPFFEGGPGRLPRSGLLPRETLTAAENYIKEQTNHLEAVRLALHRPHCSFPIKFTEGITILVPYLSKLKTESRRFRIVGALALEHGDVDNAISALEDNLNIANALAECPLLLDQLVRASCLASAVDDTQRLLSHQQLSLVQLARVEMLFQKAQMKGALRLALITERACDLSVFDLSPAAFANMVKDPGDTSDTATESGYRFGKGLLNVSGLATADRRFMLETMEKGIALADEDSSEALQKYERLNAQTSEEVLHFPPKIISGMLLPSLSGAATRLAAVEARRRAALAAIAIERYRLSHQNTLPGNLEALVPDPLPQLPIDPFNGHSLQFHTRTNGFVVYSVGKDRQDDGGKERPEKSADTNYDETFIVER